MRVTKAAEQTDKGLGAVPASGVPVRGAEGLRGARVFGCLYLAQFGRKEFSGRSPRAAFTLIEVVLAIGLFVVAAGVLAGAVYSGLQAYRSASSDALLENRYRLVLRQVLLTQSREDFERGGRVYLPDGDRADWNATLEEGTLLELFTAQVTVRLDQRNADATTREQQRDGRTFDLYLYRPGWMEPSDRGRLLEERRRMIEEQRGRPIHAAN